MPDAWLMFTADVYPNHVLLLMLVYKCYFTLLKEDQGVKLVGFSIKYSSAQSSGREPRHEAGELMDPFM